MTIDIRFRHLQGSDPLRAYVVRCIRFQLRRVRRALSAVVVRLSDVNGPRGGVDKRCQVLLRGSGHPPVMIEEVRVDAYAAVDVAMERAALAASRGLGRMRAGRRRGLRAAV